MLRLVVGWWLIEYNMDLELQFRFVCSLVADTEFESIFMQRLISIGGELERERERVRKRRSNHRDRGGGGE